MTILVSLMFIVGLCLAGAESDPRTPLSLAEILINVTGLGLFVFSMALAHGMKGRRRR